MITRHEHSVWSKPNTPQPPPEGHGENSAAARLSGDEFINVRVVPKFFLSHGMRFFTIGSCFATHIGETLMSNGFDVSSLHLDVPKEYFEDPQYGGAIALIKFTAHSMLNEIETNVVGKSFPDHGLIKIGTDSFWDPQLHKITPTTLERSLFVKEQVRKTVSTIRDADAIFITLGFTETWFDTVTGTVLNENPFRIRALARQQNRFSFRNVDYAESLDVLERTLGLIREFNTRDVRIILTVSPVPLQRTFTNDDVLVANSCSKSVLRAVAGRLADKHDFIDYFPSYEIVTNSPRNLAWAHDMRHVRHSMVQHVIGLFSDAYVR